MPGVVKDLEPRAGNLRGHIALGLQLVGSGRVLAALPELLERDG